MSIERIYFNEPIRNSKNAFSICRDIAENKRDTVARRRVMPVGEHIITPPLNESLLETHRLKVWIEGNATVTYHKFKNPKEQASEENFVMTVNSPQDTRMVIFHALQGGKDMIFGMLYYRPLESPLW